MLTCFAFLFRRVRTQRAKQHLLVTQRDLANANQTIGAALSASSCSFMLAVVAGLCAVLCALWLCERGLLCLCDCSGPPTYTQSRALAVLSVS